MKPRGDTRELQSTAHFAAKVLFFTAYHYDHQATEDWRGDCLSRLDSRSDDDGKMLAVHARHYHLQGPKLDIDLWYSLQGDWLAVESAAEKGRRVRYLLN